MNDKMLNKGFVNKQRKHKMRIMYASIANAAVTHLPRRNRLECDKVVQIETIWQPEVGVADMVHAESDIVGNLFHS